VSGRQEEAKVEVKLRLNIWIKMSQEARLLGYSEVEICGAPKKQMQEKPF